MTHPARVLIVDDSAFMRRAVERMLSDSPAIRVAGAATDGAEAVALACELRPDVIVMDVNMPEMDGLQALEQIMARCPTPVLMLSTLTQAGAEITLRALELGAVDFMDKSRVGTAMDIYELGPQLRDKVLAVSQAEPARARVAAPAVPAAAPPAADLPLSIRRLGAVELIAIGASTGGPRALTEILPRLPAELPAAVVVAQHMPPGFTAALAERLDERCALRVREASDADTVAPGTILIAPGGSQLRIATAGGRLTVQVLPSSPGLLHHPSVDILFRSVAKRVGSAAIGVVLTGMGEDGAVGLRRMREAGAYTVVESAETAVIYGMPRAARDHAELIVPLHQMARTLIELCSDPIAAQTRSY